MPENADEDAVGGVERLCRRQPRGAALLCGAAGNLESDLRLCVGRRAGTSPLHPRRISPAQARRCVLVLHDAQREQYHAAMHACGTPHFLIPFTQGQIAMVRKPDAAS